MNPRTGHIESVYEPARFVPYDWNVIEGEHHGCDHADIRHDVTIRAWVCRCGARFDDA